MAALNKKIISEQVLYILEGGYPDSASAVQPEDIWKAAEQVINATYKSQHFSITLPSGETIPENLALNTYSATVTSTTNGKSQCTLPVMPISLPRNMGVYTVYDPDRPDSPFIPLLRSQTALLKTDTLLNNILGQVSYEVNGRKLLFNVDLPLFGISTVTTELVVLDMSQYSETDILPIPSDFENDLIDMLVKKFAPVTPENGVQNQFTTSGQQNKN